MIYLTAGFGLAVGSSCRLWKGVLHAAAICSGAGSSGCD